MIGYLTPSRLARAVLLAGILSFAGLYLASIGPYWNIQADSLYYVQAGRSLAAGEGLGSGPVHGPVTALVFAAVLRLFPTGYVALNALILVLIFASLGFAYALLRRRGNRNRALLAILLTLAATPLIHATTRLMSEPAYLVLSFAALLVIEGYPESSEQTKTADPPRWPELRTWLAGALLVATAQTRIIGMTLSLGVLLHEAVAWIRRQRRPRVGLAIAALVALVSVPLWQAYSGSSQIRGFFRNFLLRDPSLPGGAFTVSSFLERIRDHIDLLPRAGAFLLNGWPAEYSRFQLFLQVAATFAIGWGLILALRRRIGVTELYVGLYLPVVTAHMVFHEWGDYRFLVPVAPFLFYYALDAVRHAGRSLTRARRGPAAVALLATLAAIYLFGYLRVGWDRAIRSVAEAHYSPFADTPIKLVENMDFQRLALWIKHRSRPGDRYVAPQRDLVQALSGRSGDNVWIGQLSPREAFLEQLKEREIRFLLIDHRHPAIRDSLRAVVAAYPTTFRRIWELPAASLFEVSRNRNQ